LSVSYEVTEWVAADGSVVNLMDIPRVGIQPGRTGAFMPPISLSEDTIPFRHGSRIRYAAFAPREIDLPLYISGTTESDLRTRLRSLVNKFNPLDDDGRLRVTRPDGTRREIFCRCTRGMEIAQTTNRYGPTYAKAVVTFRATDPLWYDVVPQSSSFGSGVAQSFFPGTPFRLSSGTIFNASAAVENDGDLETWPIWVINGPGTNIALRNLNTGEKIQFADDFGLLANEALVIDTRETRRTVRRTTIVPTPVISNVLITSITANSATISWTTNIPSTSWVEYGTSPGVYTNSSALDPTYVTNHSVPIAGLLENTNYYFRLSSTAAEFETADTGVSEYKQLVIGSALWPLYKGLNSVSVDMQGTTEDSIVSLNFYRRYLSV
jgi:hypothetical protein